MFSYGVAHMITDFMLHDRWESQNFFNSFTDTEFELSCMGTRKLLSVTNNLLGRNINPSLFVRNYIRARRRFKIVDSSRVCMRRKGVGWGWERGIHFQNE